MREVLLNTYVTCTCASCGQPYPRQAYRVDRTSVTEQDAYRKELETGVCPACAEKLRAEQARRAWERDRHARHLAKLARRRTAADLIREYNLKHLHDKKKRKHRT